MFFGIDFSDMIAKIISGMGYGFINGTNQLTVWNRHRGGNHVAVPAD